MIYNFQLSCPSVPPHFPLTSFSCDYIASGNALYIEALPQERFAKEPRLRKQGPRWSQRDDLQEEIWCCISHLFESNKEPFGMVNRGTKISGQQQAESLLKILAVIKRIQVYTVFCLSFSFQFSLSLYYTFALLELFFLFSCTSLKIFAQHVFFSLFF